MFEQEPRREPFRRGRRSLSIEMVKRGRQRPLDVGRRGAPLEHQIADGGRRAIADRVMLVRRIVDKRSGAQTFDVSAFRLRAIGDQDIGFSVEDDQ